MGDTLDLLPTRHIRQPDLPWRKNDLTECGLSADDRKTCSWVEARTGMMANGKERPTLLCRTCWQAFAANGGTAPDESAIDRSHIHTLYRELTRASYAQWPRLGLELRALGDLVDRHRPEFESLLAAMKAERALVRPPKAETEPPRRKARSRR